MITPNKWNPYRMSHPLEQYVINQALNKAVFTGKVTFDISNHTGYRISQVEQLKGHGDYLTLYKYIVSSFDSEEFLLFAGFLQDSGPLTAEQCQKLFKEGRWQRQEEEPNQPLPSRSFIKSWF